MIKIIIRDNPTPLEEFAGKELSGYIEKLFKITPIILTEDAYTGTEEEADRFFYLYRPDSGGSGIHRSDSGSLSIHRPDSGGSSLHKYWIGKIPDLSEQGFAIRSVGNKAVWLIYDKPVTLLWAVYELAGRWGVVFSLQGDVLPSKKPEQLIPSIDEVFEPRQNLRSWRLMSDLIFGPVSWTIKQQKKVIGQLVKQKYNGVLFCMWPHHPFVDYEIDGISRESCSFNFGMKMPVRRDNIGFDKLYETDNYENPEYRNCETFSEYYNIAHRYATEIMEYAKFFDMTLTLGFNPFDFNPEFAPLLEKPALVNQLGGVTISESGNIFNYGHIRLIQKQLEAYTSTYPLVDLYGIGLPEHARNTGSFEDAWESLNSKFGLASKYNIEELLHDRVSGNITAGGFERSVKEGRMTLVMIDVLHKLIEKTGFLNTLREKGKRLGTSAGISCPSIIPVISEILWERATLTLQIGYTSSRSVRNARFLEGVNTDNIDIYQIITLQDDNVGFLPQIATASLYRLLDEGIENGIKGYYTRFWPIGDLDPVSSFVSEFSWKKEVTPESAYYSYLGNLYGKEAAPKLSQVLRLQEDATILLDMDLGPLFPMHKLVSDSIVPEAADKSVKFGDNKWAVLSLYEESLNLLNKASRLITGELSELPESSDSSALPSTHLDYWKARINFGRLVLLGLAFLADGNEALHMQKENEAVEKYKLMLDSFRSALENFSHVARDDSDRAALVTYYHLLIRENEEKLKDMGLLVNEENLRNIL